MPDKTQQEIEKNFKAFQELLPSLLASHQGKFALMHDAKIVEYFDTPRDAYIAGEQIFSDDHLFSIQEITEKPADLGYYSHALPKR